MPQVQAKDGTELYYYDWGTGLPVVLIHGWPLTSASWEYQARVLAGSGFRVIAYDRRGFGRSGWAGAGYEYDTLAADLGSILDTLDLHEATLVGFSMGGGEVARYLGRHEPAAPTRVSKAVLISAVTPYLLRNEDNPDGIEQKVFDGIVAGLQKDRPAFLEQFGKTFYGRTLINHTVSDAFLGFNQHMALSASPLATIELVHAWSATDFREDLKRFTVPTLVIHGSGDATVPIELSARRAAALVPNSTLLEYEGEPHGLIATAPDRVNADLLDFLRR